MGKMKNIYIMMKNKNWKGSPAEFLKKHLKEIENAKKHLHKENK